MIKVEFDRGNANDNNHLNNILQHANYLANNVNTHAASSSNSTRSTNVVFSDALAGALSEHAWFHYLNSGVLSNGTTVAFGPMGSSINQLDLISSNNKTMEIRSSGVRNGIDFALCHPTYMFDIIGPYTNSYKPSATYKDFYLRTLYPFDISQIQLHFNNQIVEVFLLGGATMAMMRNHQLFSLKSMKKNNSFAPNGSYYHSIKYHLALDTQQLINLI